VELDAFLKEDVVLFRSLSDREISALLLESTVTTFEENEAVIEFGEEGHFVGILLAGRAEVSLYDDTGNKQSIEVLHKGDLFGEMSLMSGDKTVADVVGLTRCRAILIPHTVLSEILVTHPDIVNGISAIIHKRLEKIFPNDRDSLLKRALRKSMDPYGLSLKKPGPPVLILAISHSGDELYYSLSETGTGKELVNGVFHELTSEKGHLVFSAAGQEVRLPVPRREIPELFLHLATSLFASEYGAQAGPDSITAIGHHLVSGGGVLPDSAVITKELLERLESCNANVKAFNAPGIAAVRQAMTVFPKARHIAVFDTSFHTSLPPYAFLYAIPFELYKEKEIRRLGFHGIAHQYSALKAAQYLNRPYNELEIAVCYLDTQASVCAVDHGRSVDVSAGFTPNEGLVSGRATGSVDPALVFYLSENAGFSAEEASVILREKSGLAGLSGISPDIRDIEAHSQLGHHRALLAYKLYCYTIRKKIGEALAAMGGLDVLVFTGSIGYASAGVRSLACQGLSAMGIVLDEKRNRTFLETNHVGLVSQSNSTVKVLVVKPDKTLMIARETLKALKVENAANLLKKQEAIAVPIEVSAHHVHLTREHTEALFGKGAVLEAEHELSQPGQFASKQKVTLSGPKGIIERVRVLGPERSRTQVEIAMTEQFKLGIEPPVRESGDIEGSPGITIEGTAGTVTIDRGVICALRHIHMSQDEALRFGLHDKDVVRVRVSGDRELIFGDVLIRVNPNFRLAMHIDTDEANASHIKNGEIGYIEGIQSRA
jgi:acetate kinase